MLSSLACASKINNKMQNFREVMKEDDAKGFFLAIEQEIKDHMKNDR